MKKKTKPRRPIKEKPKKKRDPYYWQHDLWVIDEESLGKEIVTEGEIKGESAET